MTDDRRTEPDEPQVVELQVMELGVVHQLLVVVRQPQAVELVVELEAGQTFQSPQPTLTVAW